MTNKETLKVVIEISGQYSIEEIEKMAQQIQRKYDGVLLYANCDQTKEPSIKIHTIANGTPRKYAEMKRLIINASRKK